LSYSPQKQKDETQQTLVRWLLEEAEKTPLYCLWEDLHRADPSTLELLTLCLEHTPTARMFSLLVFRPEFIPPWETRSYISQLTLSRLGHLHVTGLIANVTSGRALPNEVAEEIFAKTDGVPLFVEELTKMVVESGIVQPVNSHYELTGSLATLHIPSTVHDLLMARLDRLATAKEVAQLGSRVCLPFATGSFPTRRSGDTAGFKTPGRSRTRPPAWLSA
jgi:predicted ATPase